MALSEFAALTFAKESNVKIHVDGGSKLDFQVDSSNSMVLQTQELLKIPEKLLIQATGKGTALVTLSWTYYMKTPTDESFDITCNITPVTRVEFRMHVCVRSVGLISIKGNGTWIAVMHFA